MITFCTLSPKTFNPRILVKNTSFVKSAIQYVKVDMDKLLQTHRF